VLAPATANDSRPLPGPGHYSPSGERFGIGNRI
jgi:hypothetical protein